MKNEIKKWFKKDMVSQIVDKEIKKRIKRYPIVLAKTKKEVMQFKNVKDICVYVDLDPKHTLKIKNKFKPVLILAGETNCVSEYSGLNCILYGQSWIRGVVNHCEFHESSMGCVVYGEQIILTDETSVYIKFAEHLHMCGKSTCYIFNTVFDAELYGDSRCIDYGASCINAHEKTIVLGINSNKESTKTFKGCVTLQEDSMGYGEFAEGVLTDNAQFYGTIKSCLVKGNSRIFCINSNLIGTECANIVCDTYTNITRNDFHGEICQTYERQLQYMVVNKIEQTFLDTEFQSIVYEKHCIYDSKVRDSFPIMNWNEAIHTLVEYANHNPSPNTGSILEPKPTILLVQVIEWKQNIQATKIKILGEVRCNNGGK